MKKDVLAFVRPGLAIASIVLTFFIIFSEPYSVHVFNDSDEYQPPVSTETPARAYCLQVCTKTFFDGEPLLAAEIQHAWIRPKKIVIRSSPYNLIILIRDLRI